MDPRDNDNELHRLLDCSGTEPVNQPSSPAPPLLPTNMAPAPAGDALPNPNGDSPDDYDLNELLDFVLVTDIDALLDGRTTVAGGEPTNSPAIPSDGHQVNSAGAGMEPPASGPPVPSQAGSSAANDFEAGPSGIRQLVFRRVPLAVCVELDCYNCQLASCVHDYSNGLYYITITLHRVGDQIDHIIFEAQCTDFRLPDCIDIFRFDFEGQDLETVNEALARYRMHVTADGTLLTQGPRVLIYDLILAGMQDPVERAGLDADIPDCTAEPMANTPEEEEAAEAEAVDDAKEKAEAAAVFGAETAAALLAEAVRTPESTEEFDLDKESMLVQVEEEAARQGRAIHPWMRDPNQSRAPTILPRAQRPPRPPVGVQRERTATMTLMDLAQFFHLKADDAAAGLNICTTTLKILCRKLKLGRWPGRKIKSLDNRIAGLRIRLEDSRRDGLVQAALTIQREIEKLERKRIIYYLWLTRPRPRD